MKKLLTQEERAAERFIHRAARCLPFTSPGLARRTRVQLRLAARKLIADVAARYAREVLAHGHDRDTIICADFLCRVAQQDCTPAERAIFANVARLRLPTL